MKKIVLAALLASVAFATQAAEKIRFASSATYPPFESLNGENQIVGFDIDLANALCAQMKAECSFSNNPFDSLVPALKFRRYDAVISGMDITTERSKQVSFTQPYYANSAIVIAQKGKFSTTHQKYLQGKHPEMITVAYDSYQNAILDLKNGRLEGILGDSAVVGGWLKTNANLATVGEHITDSDFFGTGVGIAVRKDNQALLKQFNAAIDVLKANGTIDRLDRRWFTR
ncbi:transporter substrate-binding domain-containing protein [Erwinia pyrifoliae]|uniref:transporter substrate-binding domain-containing protein n=1 Tax=Erwinia pyrifoliae TaxID=79967 RepID=UPI0034D97F5C